MSSSTPGEPSEERSPRGDRFYVQPTKSIADMTDDELRHFADVLASGMKRFGRKIAARDEVDPGTAPE